MHTAPPALQSVQAGTYWLASAILAVAAASAAGCTRYSTVIARDVERGDFALHLESAAAARGKDVEVVLRTDRVPPDVSLVQALLTREPAACREGYYTRRLGRSGASAADAPLAAGERLTLAFPTAAIQTLLDEGAQVDLLVRTAEGEHRCVGVPLAAAEAPLELKPEERITFGVDFGGEGFGSTLGAVQQVLLLPVHAGIWAGSYHFEAGAGIAWAGCHETRCEVTSDDGRVTFSTGFVGQAGLSASLFERNVLALRLSARYRALYLPANTHAGRRSVWAHGPVVAPLIAAVKDRFEGAGDLPGMPGSRDAWVALELPVGYALADNGDRAVTFGAAMRIQFTAL